MHQKGATIVSAILAVSLLPYVAAGQTSTESAPGVPTVAVLDFTGLMVGEGGNSVPLGKAISSMLITEFSTREGIRVIERQELQSLLEEQRLALSGRVDESSAAEVGRLIGAQYVIAGQATSIANLLRMDIRAVDVETSQVLGAQRLTDQTTELLSMVVQIADVFASELDLEAPASRPTVEAIPVQATIAFSRAVDFEDRGDTDRAVEFYRTTLEIHPGHQGAQDALERLGADGGDE